MKFDLNDFHKKYKWSATYNETNSLVSLFLNSLSNKELMSHIKFNNDYLNIPPVYTFVIYHKDFFINKKKEWDKEIISSKALRDKQVLGALFGYLYQYGAYKNEYDETLTVSVSIPSNYADIKKASIFKKKDINK